MNSKTPAREAAELAVKILQTLKRPDWDNYHFQVSAMKGEFQALITEHKLTAQQIDAELALMQCEK